MFAKFIEEWNSALSYKLDVAHLQNPNETFLFGALSCFLQHFNINVTKMDEESFADEDSHLRFRVEFCHYVDQLIRIASPKDNFVYYDLVCPASKKTVYILKLLLNYYHFYKMCSDEVIGKASALIEDYEHAQLERNQLKRKKQIYRDQLAEIEQQSANLGTQIAYAQKTTEDLQRLSASTAAQMAADQRQLTEVKLANLGLEQRLSELGDQVVTDEEADALMRTIEDLDAELEQLEHEEREMLQSHRDVSEQIGQVGKNIESGERFLETFTMDHMTALKQLQQNVADMQLEIETSTAKGSALQEQISAKRLETQELQTVVDQIAAKLSETNLADASELSKLKRDRQKAADRQARMDGRLAAVEARVQVAEEECDFIVNEVPKLLQLIRDS